MTPAQEKILTLKELGFSDREIALMLDVSTSYLNTVKTGKNKASANITAKLDNIDINELPPIRDNRGRKSKTEQEDNTSNGYHHTTRHDTQEETTEDTTEVDSSLLSRLMGTWQFWLLVAIAVFCVAYYQTRNNRKQKAEGVQHARVSFTS